MNKMISVRIPEKMYNKINTHELKNSDIIRKALTQYFRRKEPNSNLDLKVINMYNKQIQNLEQTNEFLKNQIEDWKKISIMNSSIWQILKMRLLQEKRTQLIYPK